MSRMASTHKIELRFTVFCDNISPALVSEATGIAPTSVTEKGVVPQGGTRPARHSIWSLHSNLPSENSTVEDQWVGLSGVILSRTKIFEGYPKGSCKISVIAEAISILPGISIPAGLSRFAANIGADIDIDLYISEEYCRLELGKRQPS